MAAARLRHVSSLRIIRGQIQREPLELLAQRDVRRFINGA
jgi:hypothetical protein